MRGRVTPEGARRGDAIRKARKARGETQAELADRAKVGLTLIGYAERGQHVSPTTLRAIAYALPEAGIEVPADQPQRREGPRISPVLTSHPDDPAFWVALADEVPRETFDELWKLYQDRRRLLAERSYSNRSDLLNQSRSEDDAQ